ncbi:alpha/beta hydrolase [Mycobacterium sp. OTB74]|uniref:alpha/beta fold hydrolase n=1 Tax=Mycobacterium sp. OTB74 TaxID=1853452 RepID=UPI0024741DC8|nr:alpha/beta hydrolase [Mycobacterium sp. OTB74]
MAGISAFRSDEARAAYCKLYDAALATSTVPVTESDIETSFGRTHMLNAGDPSNPPLVALHGSGISSTMWVPLLSTLAASHSVTMIDAIGEPGKSLAAKPLTDITQMVEWLDETLRAVGIQRPAIVAASRGTLIATHYAMDFPDRVDRLALVGPIGIVSRVRLSKLVRALATGGVRPTERRVQSLLDATVMPTNRGLLRQEPWGPIIQQFIAGTIGFKPASGNLPKRCDLQRLSSAQIPVVAIIGRDETFHSGPKMATRFRQQLPEARIELLDDANHNLFVDQTDIVEKLLADFLKLGIHRALRDPK